MRILYFLLPRRCWALYASLTCLISWRAAEISAALHEIIVQRDCALEGGVEFDKEGIIGLDHVNPITDDDDIYNSIISAKDFVASMSIQPRNFLAFLMLMAPTSAYPPNPVIPITTKELSNGLLFGNHIGLVTAAQARNNARLVFDGSLYLFGNK
ncbi:hypothetical protein PsorP6_007126 [Peronosclerospora sorghi]|uniref:Uncharacterized protein n=1 Tax=Peronosclerospora sorghi TaxID=230839 RepID=A0ACC0W960_9STRA|nr:hypothetical protein PsorP6_007126 [Peronosclerospora sorghi]